MSEIWIKVFGFGHQYLDFRQAQISDIYCVKASLWMWMITLAKGWICTMLGLNRNKLKELFDLNDIRLRPLIQYANFSVVHT